MKLDSAVLAPLRELGGDALVRKLFRTFLDHMPTRLSGLRHGAETRDLEELGRAVHSLRSSSAMLGAMEVSAHAGRLEALAEVARLDDLLAGLPQLETELEELAALLERELASPAG